MKKPTKIQRKNWTLPSLASYESFKLSKKSTYLTVIGIILAIILFIWQKKDGKELEDKVDQLMEFAIKEQLSNISVIDSLPRFDFKKELGYTKKEIENIIEFSFSNSIMYLREGNIAFLSRDYERAINAYNIFLKDKVKNHQAYITKAISLFMLKEYDKAIKIYESQIILNPNNYEALSHLGIIMLKLDKTNDAISFLSRAIEIKPNNSVANDNLAVAYSKSELDKHKALKHFNISLQLNDKSITTFSNKALYLFEQNDFEGSIQCYKKALLIAPNSVKLLCGISAPLINLSQYDEAIDYCDRALSINSFYSVAYLNKGFALYKINKKEEAEDNVRKSLDINPDNERANYCLALILYLSERFEESLHFNQQALKIKPNSEIYKKFNIVIKKHTKNTV